jgi:hypothetical protein
VTINPFLQRLSWASSCGLPLTFRVTRLTGQRDTSP